MKLHMVTSRKEMPEPLRGLLLDSAFYVFKTEEGHHFAAPRGHTIEQTQAYADSLKGRQVRHDILYVSPL